MVRFGARSRRYSRRFYRRRPYVPRSVRSYVRRVVSSNIENKRNVVRLDTTWGSVPSAWTEGVITRIPQGDHIFARVGRRINVRSIEIKGVITQGTSGLLPDDAYNVVRIVLGLWSGLSTTNSAPLSASSLTISDPISSWNSSGGTNTYRLIRKYLDRYITFSSPSMMSDDGISLVPATRTFSYFKRFVKPMYIQFTSGDAESADRWFCLSMISDSSFAPNPGFASGYCLVTYEDA